MSLIRKLGVMLVCGIIPFLLEAQGVDKQAAGPKQLQAMMGVAIAKSGPASVRMWGYDTLAAVRTSAQFTGVVVKDGYIMTAAHVTIPGNTYKVMFKDGRECMAKALGKIEFGGDKTRPDVALMKILTKGNWPEAPIGSSAALKAFVPCISIAYPESLNQPKPTVRFGYVTDALVVRGFIKSTCIMEPGDSGGPLFDLDGRVIGLHSAIETAESDNYDVPVDLYKKYWTALNEPMVYHALPVKADAIEPVTVSPELIPGLKNMAAFTGTDAKLKNACVKITSMLNGNPATVTGTLVSIHGTKAAKKFGETIIISKSSMVGDQVAISTEKNKQAATIIARDKANDLVFLRASGHLDGGLKLTDLKTYQKHHPGDFLITPLPDTAAVISVLSSDPFDLSRVTSIAFSGATVAHNASPATIYFVRPGSQAAAGGIEKGDIVTAIGSTPIHNADDYAAEMLKHWPGDTVTLHLKRIDAIIEKQLVLSYPPQMKYNHPAEYFAGGKSIRRDGFSDIYTHDAILKPAQCGGPVFDLDGHCAGINIARFSRANSVFIPANIVVDFINKVTGDKPGN